MSKLLYCEKIILLFSVILFQGCAQSKKDLSIENLNYFFGDLHQHTTISDGNVEIEESLRHTKELKVLDFVAITDHSHYYDFPEEWEKSQNWKRIQQVTAGYNEDGTFVTLPGFEWSKNKETGTGGRGHINVFNTTWWATGDSNEISVEKFYEKLAATPGSIAMFNHPSKRSYKEFGFHNSAVDQRIVLFEIATRSGRPSFKPRLETYVYALDKGWHLAPADNTDTHKGFWWAENCFGRTAVIADSLTRNAIYKALQNRRAYATYDRNLKVNFLVNGQLMGAILKKPEQMNAVIQIQDPDQADVISKIEILTEAGEVFETGTFDSNSVEWSLPLDTSKKYYFLRITQADKDLAFSAPIWSGR